VLAVLLATVSGTASAQAPETGARACDRGYRRVGTECIEIAVPENASLDDSGRDWTCNVGVVERNRRCVGAVEASDIEIRRVMIAESLALYAGRCPCPYFVDRAGRRCGGRSAYSRPGGESPLCFDHDIPDSAVRRYRERLKGGQ
jgi:hypothetical protein